MHFRIALAVLGRRWRGDQRSVDDSAFAHHQAFLGQVPVNRVEDLARQPLGFKQVAELQQGRRFRRRFAAQVDADESTMQLATRRYAVYLREETVTPRQLLLGGVFKVGEALLHGQWRTVAIPYCLRSNRSRERCQMNKSVLP